MKKVKFLFATLMAVICMAGAVSCSDRSDDCAEYLEIPSGAFAIAKCNAQ